MRLVRALFHAERREARDGAAGDGEVARVELDADAGVADRRRRRERGASTHEGIEDGALAEREGRAHEVTHERLGFEGGVRGDASLVWASRGRADGVGEGDLVAGTAQAAGVPLAEVVLDAALARFTKEAPRLPCGARHDGHVRELAFGVLRPIAAAQGL